MVTSFERELGDFDPAGRCVLRTGYICNPSLRNHAIHRGELTCAPDQLADAIAALPTDNGLQVLDYGLASEVIKTASHRGVGMCYCRHKMEHLDRACDAPMQICMTFNNSAASLIKHGFAREVEIA